VGTGAGWVRRKLTLTDPDPHVRMCARDFIGAVIDFAGGFGAPAIIGSMQGRWGGDVSKEQALAWLREELDQLGPRAHALESTLLLEPLNRYESNLFNTVAETLAFLDTLRTKNVKLLCDLFHMNLEEADLPAALRLAGPRLGHVHFADSNRRAIGLGHTDVAPIAAALKDIGYAGYVSAEVLPLPDATTTARQTMASFRQWFR
jgi:sugar phosphate isomerase/epimerase